MYYKKKKRNKNNKKTKISSITYKQKILKLYIIVCVRRLYEK